MVDGTREAERTGRDLGGTRGSLGHLGILSLTYSPVGILDIICVLVLCLSYVLYISFQSFIFFCLRRWYFCLTHSFYLFITKSNLLIAIRHEKVKVPSSQTTVVKRRVSSDYFYPHCHATLPLPAPDHLGSLLFGCFLISVVYWNSPLWLDSRLLPDLHPSRRDKTRRRSYALSMAFVGWTPASAPCTSVKLP